jgi:sulfoquinovosyltransferase
LGSLEGLPLSQAYASADVFVMPSDTETLGFVVMEAMAPGVPVVGCKAGGLLDLIQDNTTGFLVPTGCIDEFVDKIWTLSQDDGLYDRLSSNGLEASKDWSWESSMDFMRCQVYPDAIRRFRQDRYQRRRRRQFWGWPILSLGWRREPKVAARGEDIMPPERL